MTYSVRQFEDSYGDEAASDAGFGALETRKGCLPLTKMDVRADIQGLASEVVIRQTFWNTTDESLEATYVFPLPDRGAVFRFTMHVADRVIEASLMERDQARQQYQEAVDQGHRAAIAEEERPGVFTLRVGNLPAGENAEVELSLITPLDVSDGEAEFRFPLVVALRYTPGIQLRNLPVGLRLATDTDQVPDASRVTPPVMLPGFTNPVELSLEVALDGDADSVGSDRLMQARCSLHNVLREKCGRPVVRLQPRERLNRDFILRFPVATDKLQTSLQTSPVGTDRPDVFELTIIPPRPAESRQLPPRDVVFLLDRSGSMGGWKMVAARRAVGRIVDSLGDRDRFVVIAFDDLLEYSAPASMLVPATNRQRWRALEWVGKLEDRGGTAMQAALVEAARLLADVEVDRRRLIVLVTDGQITGEDLMLRRLSAVDGSSTIEMMTVGIDQAVNAGLLTRLAQQYRGQCELVESEQRLDEAMDSLHRIVGSPVLTDLTIEPAGMEIVAGSVTPYRLPSVFEGRPVTIRGRYLAGPTDPSLVVRAIDVAGKPWEQRVTGHRQPGRRLIHQWGRAKVRELEDRYAAGDPSDRLRKEIVDTSLESQVLSRFTAMVAVDAAESVNPGGQNRQIIQPVEFPAGWQRGRQNAPGDLSVVAEVCCQSFLSETGSFKRFSLARTGYQPPPTSTTDLESLVQRATSEGADQIAIVRAGSRFVLRCLAGHRVTSRRDLSLDEVDDLLDEIRDKCDVPSNVLDAECITISLQVDGKSIVLQIRLFPSHVQQVLAIELNAV